MVVVAVVAVVVIVAGKKHRVGHTRLCIVFSQQARTRRTRQTIKGTIKETKSVRTVPVAAVTAVTVLTVLTALTDVTVGTVVTDGTVVELVGFIRRRVLANCFNIARRKHITRVMKERVCLCQ